MLYTKEFNLYDFETWAGATHTKDIIIKVGKAQEFNYLIEDIFDPFTPTDTQINDLLWFESEYIFELLGIEV